MIGPLKYVVVALAAALALALAALWWTSGRLETVKEERIRAIDALANAKAAAAQCSAAVDGLASEAAERRREAESEVAAAHALADAANQRATVLMRKKPKYAGDDCKSAAAQVDEWLSVRGGRK